jgi:extracellular elastinolytic metalloproteinase
MAHSQFYRGSPPEDSGELDFSPRADHCNDIKDQFSSNYQVFLKNGRQSVLAGSFEQGREHVGRVIDTHCTPSPVFEANHPATELQALLAFMVTASPDAKLSEDLRKDSTKYINQMTMSVEHELLGTGSSYQIIDNVPGAVSPVKARMAYVQVPKGEETILTPVFKVCTALA